MIPAVITPVILFDSKPLIISVLFFMNQKVPCLFHAYSSIIKLRPVVGWLTMIQRKRIFCTSNCSVCRQRECRLSVFRKSVNHKRIMFWYNAMRESSGCRYPVRKWRSVYGFAVFTARCTLVQNAVLWSHVVCLSVCLPLCLWRWWIVIT